MLVGSALVIGAGAIPPEVPWWGQLLMVIVSVILSFFGGKAAAEDRGR